MKIKSYYSRDDRVPEGEIFCPLFSNELYRPEWYDGAPAFHMLSYLMSSNAFCMHVPKSHQILISAEINIGTKECGCLFNYHAVVIICWVLRIVFENHRYNSDNTDAARRVILPIKYVALHYVSASLVSQIHHQVECCAFMLFCMKKPQCQPFTIEQKRHLIYLDSLN